MIISPFYIEDGYISKVAHPTLPLYIYNYTHKTQFEQAWNEFTLQARGLIVDRFENVVSRPFPKFFNWGEPLAAQPVDGPISVTDKMDGSLGILYSYGDIYGIASRGSFTSVHAKRGSQILDRYMKFGFRPLDRYTYLFEIIFPDNRIVVDYGDMEDLVFITAIHNNSREELNAEEAGWPGPCVKTFAFNSLSDVLAAPPRLNAEGFVVRFANGGRVKVKYDEYVRLHKILTNCTEKRIWEELSNGRSIEVWLNAVPDEFYIWVKEVESNLKKKYNEIENRAELLFKNAMNVACKHSEESERKWFAEFVKTHELASIAFSMYDAKPYDHIIWRMIKPCA